jgi:hypothetical protein
VLLVCHSRLTVRHPPENAKVIESVIELLFELFFQLFVEILFELGIRSLVEPLRAPQNPLVAAIGYALLGTGAGGMSLWLLPHHLVANADWRFLNLIITPMLAGAAMALVGVWRRRRGQTLLRIDRFFYGYLFALAMALVRFKFAA